MNESNSLKIGALIGLAIWIVFTICDAFDEYILHSESSVGTFICFAGPLVMITAYIIYYVKFRPTKKLVIKYFIGYLTVSIILALIICYAIGEGKYIVSTECQGCSFLCFNGIEYGLYGVFMIAGVMIGICIFHAIFAIINIIKRRRG